MLIRPFYSAFIYLTRSLLSFHCCLTTRRLANQRRPGKPGRALFESLRLALSGSLCTGANQHYLARINATLTRPAPDTQARECA